MLVAQENDEIAPDDGLALCDERIKAIDGILSKGIYAHNLDALLRLLDGFLEDPTLLDPFLKDWCEHLSNGLLTALATGSDSSLKPILSIFNHLCKIRGATLISYNVECLVDLMPV